MPYYIKSERANLKGLDKSPWHGRDGELSVEDVPFRLLSFCHFIITDVDSYGRLNKYSAYI